VADGWSCREPTDCDSSVPGDVALGLTAARRTRSVHPVAATSGTHTTETDGPQGQAGVGAAEFGDHLDEIFAVYLFGIVLRSHAGDVDWWNTE